MFEPRPNQRLAMQFALSRTHCAWWLQMGAGKTVCSLSVARHWLHSLEVRRVLVVAPKRVAEETWPAEVGKWPHLAGLQMVEIRGTPAQRERAAQAEGDVYVIGRENLPWLVKTFAKTWRWDALIFDEASSVKKAGTQRFKALRRVQHVFARVLLLTGTPRPNTLLELWPQIWLLDRGQRLESSFSRFRAKYFDSDYMGYKWEPKPTAEDDIHEKLQDLCISLDSDAELPEPDIEIVPVQLPPVAMSEYRAFERQQILLAKGDRPTIPAANAAALVGKLSQFAGGFVYDDEGEAHEHDTSKIEALQDLISGFDEPVLLAYWFKHDRDRLLQAIPQARTLDEPDAVERWNAGRTDLLLIHPASAGHGLNLQAGGRVLIWFGPIWSLELWQQTIARLQRTGQTRPVLVRVLVSTGTVDETVIDALNRKDAGQQSTLDAVRGELEKVA